MTDFYVPVDYSSLKYDIPQDEEIIYSTLCEAVIEMGDPLGPGSNFIRWITHVLITNKGIAYQEVRKRKPAKFKYCPWHKVVRIWGKTFMLPQVKLRFIRDPNFESEAEFDERVKIFPGKFIPLWREKRGAAGKKPPRVTPCAFCICFCFFGFIIGGTMGLILMAVNTSDNIIFDVIITIIVFGIAGYLAYAFPNFFKKLTIKREEKQIEYYKKATSAPQKVVSTKMEAEPSMFCVKCGNKRERNQVYCPKCDTKYE